MKQKRMMCVVALMCIWAARLHAQLPVEYLKLTRENIPKALILMEACERNLGFDSESTDEWRTRERRSVLLPTLSVQARLDEDVVGHSDYVADYQVTGITSGLDTDPLDPSYAVQTQGQRTQTGYDDRLSYNGYLEWNFRDLMIHSFDHLILSSKIYQDDQTVFLLNEVSSRYAALWKNLPETDGTDIPAARTFKVMENAGILDALSGGLISDTLKALEDKAAAAVTPLKLLPAEEGALATEATAPPKVIEVDDGQDDTIERLGAGN